MPQPSVESIDRDLTETSRRYERAMARCDLELADFYEQEVDMLLERRTELTRLADAEPA